MTVTVSDLESLADAMVQRLTCKGRPCAVCPSRWNIGGHHLIRKSQCHGSWYRLRHDPRNVLPLCAVHHGWAHAKEKAFEAWLKDHDVERHAWMAAQTQEPKVVARERTIDNLYLTIIELARLLDMKAVREKP